MDEISTTFVYRCKSNDSCLHVDLDSKGFRKMFTLSVHNKDDIYSYYMYLESDFTQLFQLMYDNNISFLRARNSDLWLIKK